MIYLKLNPLASYPVKTRNRLISQFFQSLELKLSQNYIDTPSTRFKAA